MAFKKDAGPIKYEIKEDGINELIDEGSGNMVLMLREVSWNGREPKLELRKWIVDVNEEKPMRGVSFITEEGPNKLTEIMINKGYGKTETVLNDLKDRDDFDSSLNKAIGKKKVEKAKNTEVIVDEDEYFDPNNILG